MKSNCTYSRMVTLVDPNVNLEMGVRLLSLSMMELLTDLDRLLLKSERFKPIIIKYLQEHKDVTTSELADFINQPYADTFSILKKLEKEHKIVIS